MGLFKMWSDDMVSIEINEKMLIERSLQILKAAYPPKVSPRDFGRGLAYKSERCCVPADPVSPLT